MISQFFSIGLIVLLSAMLPGPDFAMVTKNTILHSRRAGFFTSLGISVAVLIHITYCTLGLALIISQSFLLFSAIKYVGAIYLIYLGIISLLTKHINSDIASNNKGSHKSSMSNLTAFRQGFLCNLFNPKATLFFLALFTFIIKPNTSSILELLYAIEIFIIVNIWFCSLTIFLSHPYVVKLLNKTEKYISKVLGVFLIGFGVALFFVEK